MEKYRSEQKQNQPALILGTDLALPLSQACAFPASLSLSGGLSSGQLDPNVLSCFWHPCVRIASSPTAT